MRDTRVQINGVEQLPLLDVLAFGVGDMDGAGTDEQRLAPIRQRGNVGGEGGNHGLDSGHGGQLHVGDLKFEFGFGFAGNRIRDLLA